MRTKIIRIPFRIVIRAQLFILIFIYLCILHGYTEFSGWCLLNNTFMPCFHYAVQPLLHVGERETLMFTLIRTAGVSQLLTSFKAMQLWMVKQKWKSMTQRHFVPLFLSMLELSQQYCKSQVILIFVTYFPSRVVFRFQTLEDMACFYRRFPSTAE